MSERQEINHIIGSTRTIQTAVLVVEYLKERCTLRCKIHPDLISYRFKEPTPTNGWWSADIIVKSHSVGALSLDDSGYLVDICRAFVAGRGEIWA